MQPLVNDLSFPPSVLTAVHHGILLLLPLFSTLLCTMRKADAYELAILMELYTILETLHLHMHPARKLSTSDMLNYDRIRTILLYVENNYNRELTCMILQVRFMSVKRMLQNL